MKTLVPSPTDQDVRHERGRQEHTHEDVIAPPWARSTRTHTHTHEDVIALPPPTKVQDMREVDKNTQRHPHIHTWRRFAPPPTKMQDMREADKNTKTLLPPPPTKMQEMGEVDKNVYKTRWCLGKPPVYPTCWKLRSTKALAKKNCKYRDFCYQRQKKINTLVLGFRGAKKHRSLECFLPRESRKKRERATIWATPTLGASPVCEAIQLHIHDRLKRLLVRVPCVPVCQLC